MARLFLTQREFDLFSDTVKEVMKDVSGQAVYYYPVNYEKTTVNETYQEAIEKVFDRPVYLPAVVDFQGVTKPGMDSVALSKVSTLEVHLHKRDMDENNIHPKEGDFLQFAGVNYEIKLVTKPGIQYGHAERLYWYKLQCEQTDQNVFYEEDQPPTALQQASVEGHFTQIRGSIPSDHRALQAEDSVGPPITGVKSSPFDGINDDD